MQIFRNLTTKLDVCDFVKKGEGGGKSVGERRREWRGLEGYVGEGGEGSKQEM